MYINYIQINNNIYNITKSNKNIIGYVIIFFA